MEEYRVPDDDYHLNALVILAEKLGFEVYRNTFAYQQKMVSSNNWVSFKRIDPKQDD